MSKSKKRILYSNKTKAINCSRDDAVRFVTNSVKSCSFDKEAKNMISLFGISGEELSEAGLTWEELKIVSPFL